MKISENIHFRCNLANSHSFYEFLTCLFIILMLMNFLKKTLSIEKFQRNERIKRQTTMFLFFSFSHPQ